jgi:PKD repeat protein
MKKIVAVLCGLVLLVGLYGCWPILLSPVAEFEWTVAGLSVTFDAGLSYDSDGNIVSYEWQFGDEATGIGPAPVHVYDDYGSYAVQLIVTDNDGKTGISTHTVTLVDEPINHAPVANFTWTQNKLHAYFDGRESSDEDNDIVDYLWSFGDGGEDSGIYIAHTYSDINRSWLVTLTVVDDDGLSDVIQQTITFCNSGVQSASLSVMAPQNDINIFCYTYNAGLLVLFCENVSGRYLNLVDIAVHGDDAGDNQIDAGSNTAAGIASGESFDLSITLGAAGIVNIDVYDIDVI